MSKFYKPNFKSANTAHYFCQMLFIETGITASRTGEQVLVRYSTAQELERIKGVRSLFTR